MIIGIVAISENFAIGRGGKLPWHYSSDLKFFRETTTGNAIVMGSNTWHSIGRPLPNRLNIVLTRTGQVEVPAEVMKLGSTSEVIALSRYLTRDVYVIGGASVFAAFADVIDRWIVTYIPALVDDADTFMPQDFLSRFKVSGVRDLDDGLVVRFFDREQQV
jgi:dihydrofolate reductase